MAFTSSSSDSKVSNDSKCSKSCLETVELLKSQNEQLLKDLKKSELMVLDKLENASNSLNKLIECQIVDNCKKGLGYENYNAVPPPHTGKFMPPTPDLSFTGLDEFVNKPEVENCKAKSSEEEPKVVRKYDDAPIIEEWVSDDEEEEVAKPKIEMKTVVSQPKGNPQIDLQDQRVIDSGCSRHMIGNMSYLTDYEEIDGGYVTFGGNPKEGKITGKDPKSSHNDGSKPSSGDGNSTVNAAGTNEVNVIGGNMSIKLPFDPKMPALEEDKQRKVRDLHLADEEGIDYLPNTTIFEPLTLIGYEKISQKLTFYKAFFSPQWKFLIHTVLQSLSLKTTTWNEFSSTMASTIICLAINQNFNFSKLIFESMVRNLDNMSGKFLMYPRVLDLEKTKTTQQIKIDSLEMRVKKLKRRKRSRSHRLKEGRIEDIDADDDITLVSPYNVNVLDDVEMFVEEQDDVNVKDGVNVSEEVVEEVVEAINIAKLIVDVVQVSAASAATSVSAAPTTTAATTVKEITLAQALEKMKKPEKPLKMKDQIRLDEETALRLQAEFDEEERLAREEAENGLQKANMCLVIETWITYSQRMD
ncbi:hypothetical protein Tco_0500419 [Tanacetum coccineum]